MIPRDFLGLGRLDTSPRQQHQQQHQQHQHQGPAANTKHLGPFCVQIPEGDVSLARLQQMSEQSGFQLASAFTSAGQLNKPHKGFHVGPASRASASAQAFPGYRAAATICSPHLVPPQLSSPNPNGFFRPLVQVRPRDADVEQLCRDSKFLKDNRGMRWPPCQSDVPSMKGSPGHLPASRATEVLNHRSLIVPTTKDSRQQTREAAFLSLKPPGGQAEASTKLDRQTSSKSAQLTIFYEGSVNVFDNVSSDRAQAVMLLAASMSSSDAKPTMATPAPASVAPTLPAALVTSSEQSQQSRPLLAEFKDLPQARKASLARFLVRRKERSLQKAANVDASKKAGADSVEVSEQASSELPSAAAPAETKQDKGLEQQAIEA